MERLVLQAIISRGSLLEQDMLDLYDRARSACDGTFFSCGNAYDIRRIFSF